MAARRPFGYGVAACTALGVLVTSVRDTLHVFTLPRDLETALAAESRKTRDTEYWWTSAGLSTSPPVTLRWHAASDPDDSLLRSCAYMAFTDHGRHLLLVADLHRQAVHVVDVVGQRHVGYVAGFFRDPRGVATKGSLAAVSGGWDSENLDLYDHVVHVYEGGESTWAPLHVIGVPGAGDGRLLCPRGLRFTADGAGLVVVDWGRVSMFRVADVELVRRLATGLEDRDPSDVEEVEGGWLVTCWNTHTVELVGGNTGGDGAVALSTLGKRGAGSGEFLRPSALALVPGLGLVVRDSDRIQVFATPGAVAMATMSRHRVGWMVGVARAILNRWQ